MGSVCRERVGWCIIEKNKIIKEKHINFVLNILSLHWFWTSLDIMNAFDFWVFAAECDRHE